MQKFAIKLLLVLSFILTIFQHSLADTFPKREIRAAWITPINGNWPLTSERGTTSTHIQNQKNHAIAIIEEMKANGFNAIFIHARPYSDRMFLKTSYTHNGTKYTVYEPFSHHVSGTRGTETSYDPLAFWVEECHKRGMECHAWINPLRFCNTSGDVTTPGWPCNSLNVDKEVWNNGWIIYQYQESESNKTTKFCYDPSISEVRSRINNVCAVIAGNYDVDGIVWDDYFYPDGIPENLTAGDYDRYQNYLSNGGTMTMADWRRENCNTMIREAYQSIKSIKPYIKFGLAPAGAGGGNPRYCAFTDKEKSEISVLNGNININVTWSDWQYNTIYADLIAWLREGTIDYISPQLYWSTKHQTNPFDSMCQWWQEVSSYFGRHCYPSNGFSGGYTNGGKVQDDWDEIVTQIKTTREVAITNAPGSIVYPANYFDPQLSDYYNSGLAGKTLSSNVYQKKALVPAITWQNATNPGIPQNLKFSSGKLSWDNATMIDGSVTGIGMRYAVYAIPLSVGINDAKSTIHTNDGGFKADYLLDVTYSNSFDVSSYSSSSYWYAVTIVDRYGNEWEAAKINAPNLGDVSISLSSPAHNSIDVPFSDNTFSWTSDGTSFTIQISESEDFSKPLIEEVVTTTNVTISTANFKDGATYFWRVIASKEYYNSTQSEVRSFTMGTRPTLSLTLLSPENTSTINSETISFSWDGIEGTTYTLELSKSESFENIIFSKTTTNTSYSSRFNLASTTQYYWRVKASHPNYSSVTSETRSFISPQKKSAKDNLTIKELWNFSVNKGNRHSQLGAATQRSMTAYNGNVYVITNSSGALLEFDGSTGEYNETINLSGDCFTNSSGSKISIPTNCVFVDGGNNLCVSNLVASSYSTNPLTVCTIDTETGNTTRVFESTVAIRVDYANAYGDITKDGGQIWASTNTNQIYRWTRVNGSWEFESTTIKSFYPTTATSLGTAPWVMPISETQFLVDGGSNYPTLYTFNTGGNATYVSGFDSNTALTPRTIAAGGTGKITLGKYPLFIYNSENHQGAGHNFDIVHNPSSYDFSKMESLWTKIPDGKLGDEKHSTILNSVATIKNEDNSATVFVYAPLNGLAAYRISLPNAPISLVSPINNTPTEEGFDFKWSGISDSKYTIEVSSSESFENIEFTATTEANTYSSANFSLNGSTKYYWRVKVANENYTTTTSAVAQFTSPALPTMTPPLLYKPYDYDYDKTPLSTDISFVAKYSYIIGDNGEKIYTPKTTLEISKTADFSKLYYSGTENWVERSSEASNYETWLQYTLPISIFSNGTYYWRVKAESVVPNLTEGISEVRKFVVEGQSEAPGTAETNYTPMLEDEPEYPLITSGANIYTLTNIWIRNSEKNALKGQNSPETGTNYRDFCARSAQYGDQDGKDILWLAGRNSNYSASAFLDKYDANTGEYLGRLTLTGSYATSMAACNNLFLDDAGRLCMTNIAPANGTLQFATIDPTTGAVTIKQELSVPERIDHARVIGDIENGEAYIFATSSEATVYRWKLKNGKLTSNTYESITLTSFYPATAKKLGTATRIYPIDSEYFYLDGDGSACTLYQFSSSSPVSTFAAFSSCAPVATNRGSGGTFFTHDSKHFILYSSSAFEKTTDTDFDYLFTLANVSEFTSWDSMNKYWALPRSEKFGTVINSNGAYGMLADYLQYDAITGAPKGNVSTYSSGYDRTNIFTYVPGNGMAAYSLTRHIYTGAEDVEAKNIKIGINNQEITFGCKVDNAQIYTLSGMMINSIDNSSSIELPATKGVYILRLTLNETTTNHKIVI